MAFDYKKEYKEFYLPPRKPVLVEVPPMNFVAVRGSGNPNQEDGPYQQAMQALYGIAYTIKMSKKGSRQIEGYFDYVVPPLEGFWWIEGLSGMDYSRKDELSWISCIRLPDFVDEEDFRWAVEEAERKKGADFSRAQFLTIDEGLCVQCLHVGPYDDEPVTVDAMHAFMKEQGLELDITEERRHHEIYLSDARRTTPERMRTVIRHPVKRR